MFPKQHRVCVCVRVNRFDFGRDVLTRRQAIIECVLWIFQECGLHETKRDHDEVRKKFFEPAKLHVEYELCVHDSYWALRRRDSQGHVIARQSRSINLV